MYKVFDSWVGKASLILASLSLGLKASPLWRCFASTSLSAQVGEAFLQTRLERLIDL